MKKLFLANALIIVLFICALLLSCSSGSNSNEEAGATSNIHDQGVILVTGPPDKEVVWHITNVTRVRGYMTNDKYVEGEGMIINGYCTAENGETPFFDKEKPVFIVIDNNGQMYEMGITSDWGWGSASDNNEANKDYFMMQVGLAGEGMNNPTIKSWSDLNIADPNVETVKLPGHKVSLGYFNVKT